MTEDFRATIARSGVPVPVPRVTAVDEVEVVDEDWISYIPEGLLELPDEFYLRDMQHYDSDSPLEEIAKLIESWGMLCLDDFAEWSGDSMGSWEQRAIAFEMREKYKKKYETDFLLPETLVHKWEAWPHLDFIRFLRDAWIVISATGDISHYNRLFGDDREERQRQSDTALTQHWLDALNKGLRAAHARIDHPLAHEEGATIFGACCLQLYNHIVESAQYKICANESCGQFFVRQQGRSGTEQRKTEGVKYCSSKCAKAQAQRELRRRRGQPAPDQMILDAQIDASQAMTLMALADVRQRRGMPTLGAALRAKRFELKLDDRAVRRKAKVAAPILIAIEADDYDRYDGQHVHMQRWLASLAQLYGMDDKEVTARYRADRALNATR